MYELYCRQKVQTDTNIWEERKDSVLVLSHNYKFLMCHILVRRIERGANKTRSKLEMKLEIKNNLGTKHRNRTYLTSFATFVTVKLVFLDHEISSFPSLEGIVTPLVQISFQQYTEVVGIMSVFCLFPWLSWRLIEFTTHEILRK